MHINNTTLDVLMIGTSVELKLDLSFFFFICNFIFTHRGVDTVLVI